MSRPTAGTSNRESVTPTIIKLSLGTPLLNQQLCLQPLPLRGLPIPLLRMVLERAHLGLENLALKIVGGSIGYGSPMNSMGSPMNESALASSTPKIIWLRPQCLSTARPANGDYESIALKIVGGTAFHNDYYSTY